MGVFLVTTTNAFFPANRVYSVNTYKIQLSSEGVSEPVNGASLANRSAAKRVSREGGESETNVASDRVAL